MFKIGDRVVVVDASSSYGYKNGDKGVVVDISYVDEWVDVKVDGCSEHHKTMFFSEVIVLEEDTSFKIGDTVKFKKSSLESGMINASVDDTFTVLYVQGEHVMLQEHGSWWNIDHFEHVKEKEVMPHEKYVPEVGDKVVGFRFDDTDCSNIVWDSGMEEYAGKEGVVSGVRYDYFKVEFGDTWWLYPLSLAHLAKPSIKGEEIMEEKAIVWEIGQEVFCVRFGKGTVTGILTGLYYPVFVAFDEELEASYTLEGKYGEEDKYRSLFFSEPKIIADKFPPKKAFVPTLKKGDKVAMRLIERDCIVTIEREEEDEIFIEQQVSGFRYPKRCIVEIYKLSEEIKFS